MDLALSSPDDAITPPEPPEAPPEPSDAPPAVPPLREALLAVTQHPDRVLSVGEALGLFVVVGGITAEFIAFGYWLARSSNPAPTGTDLGRLGELLSEPPVLAREHTLAVRPSPMRPAVTGIPATRSYTVSARPVLILPPDPNGRSRRVLVSTTQPVRISAQRDISYRPNTGTGGAPAQPALASAYTAGRAALLDHLDADVSSAGGGGSARRVP